MNERIKELYEQAHIERQQEYFSSVVDPTIKSVSVTRQFDPELFAELIVKECADQCTHDGPFTAEVVWGKQFREKILKHFRVE